MKERTVGVRELKSNLSACLRQVKAGNTVLISERGKPIGRIHPVTKSLDDKLQEGIRSKHWSWNGRKWRPASSKVKARGKVLVSDLLLDDRI